MSGLGNKGAEDAFMAPLPLCTAFSHSPVLCNPGGLIIRPLMSSPSVDWLSRKLLLLLQLNFFVLQSRLLMPMPAA